MKDWNVVVSVQPEGYSEARRLLQTWGAVDKTDFFNVLVARVEDPRRFLMELSNRIALEPGTLNFVGRAVPSETLFDFQRADEFEPKALEVILAWASRVEGKSFHVRMHRRGFKGRLSSQTEEQTLAAALLTRLEEGGTPGRVTFDDPDAIVAIETVGGRAGLSVWTRDELRQYPFLGLD